MGVVIGKALRFTIGASRMILAFGVITELGFNTLSLTACGSGDCPIVGVLFQIFGLALLQMAIGTFATVNDLIFAVGRIGKRCLALGPGLHVVSRGSGNVTLIVITACTGIGRVALCGTGRCCHHGGKRVLFVA